MTFRFRRSTKKEIMDFVYFFLSDEIQEILKYSPHPSILAMRLYEERTGKRMNRKTAYNNFKQWKKVMVNGKVEYIRIPND